MRKISLFIALWQLSVFVCTASVAHAQMVEADKSAARIMVYFTVGRDEAPASNVTLEQFKSHMLELAEGNYTVLPLPEIINAYKTGKALPDNVVGISFDGGEKSILQNAVPVLEHYHLPYTIFVATGRADQRNALYMDWSELKRLAASPLVTLGLHDQYYSDINTGSIVEAKRSINNATSRFREEIGENPTLFAYPFGAYNKEVKNMIAAYGFDAAFGQQSGVAYNGSDLFAIPRFTMTENYGDEQRFEMTANALPLPVEDITPDVSVIAEGQPAIGLTLTDTAINLAHMSCFASGQEKPDINIIANKRAEIRLKQDIGASRFRVNCTLPVNDRENPEETRWRWFGMLFTQGDTLDEDDS